MKERRSWKIKNELVLKDAPVRAVMTIPAGWSAFLHGGKFAFSFKRDEEKDPERPGKTRAKILHFDPYLVREKFMGIGTPEKALEFFKRFGPLDVHDPRELVEMVPGAAGVAPDITFSAIVELQDLYQKALVDPKHKFTDLPAMFRLNFFQSPKLRIVLRRQPILLAESAYISEAIYTTLYLDRLAGLPSVKCPECHKIVRQRSQHFQRFCSKRCGNISRKKAYLAKEKKHAKA